MEPQTCRTCVLDATEPGIKFDANGQCDRCGEYFAVTSSRLKSGQRGKNEWALVCEQIRDRGRGRLYDCILGLSGGIDSCYVALLSKQWNLRILALHVDGGWNTETAVSNIESVINYAGLDLHTIVIDWDEMRDLQLAYLRAGVPNLDVPQDHAFFASLFKFAYKEGISTVLSGSNVATEGISPGWMYDAMDGTNLRAIHKAHGSGVLRTFPVVSVLETYFYFPFLAGQQVVRPLNYHDYNRSNATAELTERVGWKNYGRKHGESRFTKLFQNFYLPSRYGYDKRRHHLSSLIVSGQLTRAQALKDLEQPLYQPDELTGDIGYFCEKLKISRSEFDAFLDAPHREHTDYPNGQWIYRLGKHAQRAYRRIRGARSEAWPKPPFATADRRQ